MCGRVGLFEALVYIFKMDLISFAYKTPTRGNRCILGGQYDPLLKVNTLRITSTPGDAGCQ